MSSSHPFAIMSLQSLEIIITKCVTIIYRILQYRQLSLERAPLITLKSETFHDNLFFKIATAAIAKILLYYEKYAFFEILQSVFGRVHIS